MPRFVQPFQKVVAAEPRTDSSRSDSESITPVLTEPPGSRTSDHRRIPPAGFPDNRIASRIASNIEEGSAMSFPAMSRAVP
jgi:hypothetical protein